MIPMPRCPLMPYPTRDEAYSRGVQMAREVRAKRATGWRGPGPSCPYDCGSLFGAWIAGEGVVKVLKRLSRWLWPDPGASPETRCGYCYGDVRGQCLGARRCIAGHSALASQPQDGEEK